MKLQQFLLDELENSKDNPGLTLHGEKYDNDLYISMKAFWDQFTGEITHEYTCTSCKITIENWELINYLLLKFPDDDDKKCDEDCTVESLIKYHLQEQCIKDYQCSCCKKDTSGTRKSAITKFPSFMCILLCRNKGDDNGTISSAVKFPALGFNINGDHMRYDLSATVHYKLTKGGNGHYTAISRSRDLQSQQWFMYDDHRVSSSNFTNRNTMVKKAI
jgi:ubiquitin C-terminal hydrolase